MTNNELTAAFANQLKARGQSNSMSFHGATCWTYGERLAQIGPEPMVAHLNPTKYSVTSSTHRGKCERALTMAGYTIVKHHYREWPAPEQAAA
jgi:hypothetical protein